MQSSTPSISKTGVEDTLTSPVVGRVSPKVDRQQIEYTGLPLPTTPPDPDPNRTNKVDHRGKVGGARRGCLAALKRDCHAVAVAVATIGSVACLVVGGKVAIVCGQKKGEGGRGEGGDMRFGYHHKIGRLGRKDVTNPSAFGTHRQASGV